MVKKSYCDCFDRFGVIIFVTFVGVCTYQTCFLISFLISREQNLNYRAIL